MSTLLASLYLEEFVELKDAAFAAQVALKRDDELRFLFTHIFVIYLTTLVKDRLLK